jgi:hypothetical protein
MSIDRSIFHHYPWWEEHKQLSNYHFIPTTEPEDNVFNTLCTFTGDWSAGIEKAANECYENFVEIGNPLEVTGGYKDAETNMRKLTGTDRMSLNWIANVYEAQYNDSLVLVPEFKCNQPEYKPFYQMAEQLGYTEVHAIRITFQRMSQVCSYHLDLNESYFNEHNLHTRYTQLASKDHLRLRKTFIALTPYDLGQVWYFGDQYWKNYKAGEAITFDWKNMPHGTANLGLSLRCNLLIMGFVGDKFNQLVRDGSKNNIINLD